MIIDPHMELHALELAISSHKSRAGGGFGMRKCALCELFEECEDGCPIQKLTSQIACHGTPYHRTIYQRDQIMQDACPLDCTYIKSCSAGETEYCIIEEENMVAFLKWVRYNIKMEWI